MSGAQMQQLDIEHQSVCSSWMETPSNYVSLSLPFLEDPREMGKFFFNDAYVLVLNERRTQWQNVCTV